MTWPGEGNIHGQDTTLWWPMVSIDFLCNVDALVMSKEGATMVFNYLDDFLTLRRPDTKLASQLKAILLTQEGCTDTNANLKPFHS